MAILILPDGHLTEVWPANGKDFSLNELKFFMNDGYIEVVHLNYKFNDRPLGMIMIVDDDGLRKELPLNEIATAVYIASGGNSPIVGPALLCERHEVE